MNKAIKAVVDQFDGRRRLRGYRNNHYGGMEAVKAHPLGMVRFRPDEGGTVSTRLNVKLAPVSGYMRSNAYVDVMQVFVPYQAIELLWLEHLADAGVTEMSKRRLMAGNTLGLVDEHTISKACNIHPISVGGVKKVQGSIQFAYAAAVNHARKVAYHAADQLTGATTTIEPAILTANVLERFNGVLDPERLVDGAINLTGELPVKGIGISNIAFGSDTHTGTIESGETSSQTMEGWEVGDTHGNNAVVFEKGTGNTLNIRTDLDGTSEITLRDMVESQKLDKLVRKFAQMIKDDPINGEEKVARALYGLSVDYDSNCQVMYRQVYELSPMHQRPTDGASINDVSAHFELNTEFATVVPRSELGGQLVTIAMIKPVEVLAAQPDPAQTEAWELVNRVHDETELDEVMLKRKDLESGVAAVDEDTDAFWVGHNSIKHNYVTKGPNVQQNDVANKSSMWVYEIPTSVTPANVSYPSAGVTMYPFFNWNGDHAHYTIDQVAAISTSLAKGPNPVERIQLFADDPTLVDPNA